MKKVYINGLGCISCQKTFDTDFLEEAILLENQNKNVVSAIEPVYKDYISPGAIRRMAKGVKNGIVASAMALKDASISEVDAIITGTGMGCIEDSEKFLKAIIDNNEEFLTPTSFIQSTHNTVGGQIALGMQCKGYNFTYVNGANSFESALLDAKMQLENDENASVLVGGIDEHAHYTMEFYKVAGLIKSDDETNFSVLNSTSEGYVSGEGATFFVLENEKKANSYAEILDVSICNSLEVNQIEKEILDFLQQNSISLEEIDAVVLGHNSDGKYDDYYKNLSETIFKNLPQVYYKHLSGEFFTASSFGLWMASKILKIQTIPEIASINSIEKKGYKTILLYNQYRGKDHSFTLIKHADA